MSVVNNNLLLTADAGVAPSAYQISRSLRFNSADSAYLNRTPTGEDTTWTFSCWAKRGQLGTDQYITGVFIASTYAAYLVFNANNTLSLMFFGPTAVTTTSVYRDTSAWYHIVVSVTSGSTSYIYVNGTQAASWTASANTRLFRSGVVNCISRYGDYSVPNHFDGYLADIHYIGGQALTPSSFTETNATTGQLVPKAYGGSYGVNGFRLNFSNNSAATATTLGADSSGNGNNWTPNNLSVSNSFLNGNNGTLTNGPTYSSANGGSIVFDGTNDYVQLSSAYSITNTFSIELWCLPSTTHQIDGESTSGTSGASGQRYIINPQNSGANGGAGISIGTNGVSVYEHGSAYLPCLLSYAATITSVTQVVVVYTNGQPSLYLNGTFIKNGLTSPRTVSFPGDKIGFGDYGSYSGTISSVRYYNRALSAAEVTQNYNALVGRFGGTSTGSIVTDGMVLNLDAGNTASYPGTGTTWTDISVQKTNPGNDSLTDTPTSYGTDTGAGGEVRGNYATLNPLANGGNTLSDGNLRVVGANNRTTLATIGMSSGKWYCEATAVSFTSFHVGIARGNAEIGGTGDYLGNDANGWSYFQTGQKVTNNSASAYGSSFTTNDVIGIAFDADNGTLVFYKNNVNQGTAFSGLTSGPYFFAIGANLPTAVFNFGQRPFAYAAPSGFKALCDTNLPSPTIAKPNTVMDSLLYTGSGVKTGLNFSPDLVWIKNRSSIFRPNFNDTVRGVNKQLFADGTEAELSLTDCLTAFSSSGFTVGTNGATGFGSATYVAWCWDAGSSTVTNTVGTITSQVRANANAGFGIFTYTGTGANATIGHGLNIAPALVIIKRRDTTSNWQVRHTSVAVANSIQLNLTSAAAAASTVWNSTAPSSTVVSIGTDTTVNASGGTYVGWCFAPVTGYSAFGTYTGNGSADGAFVYLEFRPAFLLIKRTNTTSDWTIFDNKRLGYNVDNNSTYANRSVAESTADLVDITSNGFKLRSTDASVNASGSTYIYAAYAENPFQYARAR